MVRWLKTSASPVASVHQIGEKRFSSFSGAGMGARFQVSRRFRFTLSVDHTLLGRLVFQEGNFFEKENTP